MMTSFAIPELTIVIGVIGAALGGLLWPQPEPKRVPVKARRGKAPRNG